MSGSPPTLLSTALTSALFIVAFVAAAYFMARRARNPKTVPRDEVERRTLPLLKSPSRREKLFFALGVIVAGAAPWLTYLLER